MAIKWFDSQTSEGHGADAGLMLPEAAFSSSSQSFSVFSISASFGQLTLWRALKIAQSSRRRPLRAEHLNHGRLSSISQQVGRRRRLDEAREPAASQHDAGREHSRALRSSAGHTISWFVSFKRLELCVYLRGNIVSAGRRPGRQATIAGR